MASHWVTVKGAAELLGWSEDTVRRAADSGRLEAHRTPGGHRRIRVDAIEHWTGPGANHEQ